MNTTIGVASDHAGYQLKQAIVVHLRTLPGVDVRDLGPHEAATSVDYPDYAFDLGRRVACGELDSGILVCGTGIGMSIAANKIRGVRCALVHDDYTARLAREHNHANVLALGGRLLAEHAGIRAVDAWLNATPEARHAGRLAKIAEAEQVLPAPR